MTDCPNAEIRDLLPAYVHDRLSAAERARVDAHLGSCDECAAELALLRDVGRALSAAPAIDVARIVTALPTPGRPAAQPAGVTPIGARGAGSRRARPSWGDWRQAAAIAAVAVGAITLTVARERTGSALGGDSAVVVAPAATSRVAPPVGGEAGSPAAAATRPSAATPSAEPLNPGVAARPARGELSMAGGVGDLSDEALRALLGDLDRIDQAPGTEPDEVLPVVSGIDEEGGR